jgi:hypothetical protein
MHNFEKNIFILLILSVGGKLSLAFQKQANDINGKYIQFNSVHNEHLNPDLPIWFRALKESTLIALEGDTKLR